MPKYNKLSNADDFARMPKCIRCGNKLDTLIIRGENEIQIECGCRILHGNARKVFEEWERENRK
jgi:DNA-directed RNA polymerase subunit RPC12/RpoP